jgi:transposase-like protein
MVSEITNKLLPKIEDWQGRQLSTVYPIVFIDAVHFSLRENNIVKKLAAYIILGLNE